MKKLFISLVAAIVAATATFAQSTLVATLTHGENVTMYYGTYALRDAHNAAVSGDVINLSSGAFQAVEIKKAITLRGTGIDAQEPTFIVNDLYINIPTSDTGRLSMEGIRCGNTVYLKGTLTNAYFLKCQFSEMRCHTGNTPTIKNAMLADCKIIDYMKLYGNSTFQFINSYVGWFENSSSNSAASFINCVVRPENNNPNYLSNSQLINCVIFTSNSDYYTNKLPSASVGSNCVAIGYTELFNYSPASTGNKKSTFAELFKTFKGNYSDSETFELTDAAKTKFLGTDGTQVGMYGGVLPYTSTPSYPQITKMNVASKTTADGKLSVEIEVSAAK